MYQKAFKKIKNSIFPIFYQAKKGNLINIGVSGTGFFINDNGLFLTAHHVISNIPLGSKVLYAGNVPYNNIQPIPFREVFVDFERDIFIGHISENNLSPVSLSYDKTEIGTTVCLCGYPLAQIKLAKDKSVDINNVRQYWQPTYAIDHSKIKLSGRLYEGFITQHASLSGMSGGPVFDIQGNVLGFDVASSTRKLKNPNNEEMNIVNGIVTSINSVQDIVKGVLNNN